MKTDNQIAKEAEKITDESACPLPSCSVSEVLRRLEELKSEKEIDLKNSKRMADPGFNKKDAWGWESAVEVNELYIETLSLAIETIQRQNDQDKPQAERR